MRASILWRRLDLPGHEIGELVFQEGSWMLSGTALFTHEGMPCGLECLVACDAGWRTKSARVVGLIGGRKIEIDVAVDAEQRWSLNGTRCPKVAGCIDIDLGFSPSTNLLPIRRLSLAVGETAEVNAAWLPFPTLEFEVLPQSYRRAGERTYHYESGGGAFQRMLEVNALGFVTSYPGLWEAESFTHSRNASTCRLCSST